MRATSISIILSALLFTTGLQAAERKYNFTDRLICLQSQSSVDVYYTPVTGVSAVEVKVIAPDDVIDRVSVTQDSRTLDVGVTPDPSHRNVSMKDVKVYVSGPVFEEYVTNSAGDIKCLKNLTCKDITLTCNSAGDLDFGSISCSTATISASSSGDIEIKGLYCKDTATITANSSGDVEIDVINAEKINVTANSSGDIDLEAISASEITANATSSGDIKLAGKVDNGSFNASSSGSIRATKLRVTGQCKVNSKNGDVKINKNK
ncbi:MAG: DUF2807 domain-containing protein [Muribaculaceae bacterium]|nr:DUF2807 domain-containing protein [Muribaculaceae bacterium]